MSKKRKAEAHSIKSYYNRLLSHSGITIQDNYHKFFKKLIFLDIFVFLVFAALLTFYVLENLYKKQLLKEALWFIYIPISLYFFLVCLTYTIYHLASISFEKKNKYELSLSLAPLGYKLACYLMLIVHFVWIVIAYLITYTLRKLHLDELREALILLLYSYLFLFFAGLLIVYYGLDFLDTLDLYFDNHVTVETYLYGVVLIVMLFCRHISSLFMKLMIPQSAKTIPSRREKILKQYSLLNAYLTFLITIVLKALHFESNEKIIVDSLFYASGIITLFTKLKNDMQKC